VAAFQGVGGTPAANASFGSSKPSKSVTYLTAVQVRKRYGDMSEMTLWRWLDDDDMRFPRPLRIHRLRYWKEHELDAWDAAQAEKAPEPEDTAPRVWRRNEELRRRRLAELAPSVL
jgi:predicted DNA-binding transcriptional regulator AlpA